MPVTTLPFIILGPDDTPKAALVAELADTPELRRRGLSKRAELPVGRGMLFDKVGAYWMKDMEFPIDIVFLDQQGTVLEKQHMPCGPEVARTLYVPASKEAASALELPAGWFDRCGLLPGDRVRPARAE